MPKVYENVDVSRINGPPAIIHIVPKPGRPVASAMSADLVMVWRNEGGTRFLIDLTNAAGASMDVAEFFSGLTGFAQMVGATRGFWALCGSPDFGRGLCGKGKLLSCRGTEFATLDEAIAALST